MASASNRFWKLLGRSVSRGHTKSRDAVDRSAEFDAWATDVDPADAATEMLEKWAETLAAKEDDLPKFLALARVTAEAAVGLRPFDTQLLGAVRLLEGDVVEMATGEGKTLSGAIAAAGFVLRGRDVHVISVNDFLARRDAEWMGPFYRALGLTVGSITATSTAQERREAYACDVTYASVNEVGFDVLRDHLVSSVEELVAPTPDVAIIDEADSVLVDEALVPLILAGSSSTDVPTAEVFDAIAHFERGVHYDTDAEGRNVFLTDDGASALEDALGVDLYSEEHVGTTLVQVNVALHALVLVRRDVDYIVRDGQVQLINSSRGRVAELQRWPDGLQAAVEAKEGLARTETGEVLDTITVQALVGRYRTVCGMTGTAVAAGEQLRKFYDLGVSVIEPNEPNIRVDEVDRVYTTAIEKIAAVVEAVRQAHESGQPVLIGTHDVAESEAVAERLTDIGIEAVVLNAKNDAEEAEIIARAGIENAVTVSTQIAGRGTDIRLGDGVAELGGLLVIGTGRYTTERLDNQLRGRSGRQGDPGRSVFFASWDDPLVTAYLAPSDRPGTSDDTGYIASPAAAKRIDHAQRVAEGEMLSAHSLTWRYNQLTAQHREIVDARRTTLLTTDAAKILLTERNAERAAELDLDDEVFETVAREIVLITLDRAWSDYLAHLADVRESIHLRALGRENPLDEYHRIAIAAFADLETTALEAADHLFRTAEIDEKGIDLDRSGVRRPSSTWTYMVHDNPFENSGSIFGF